MLVLFNVQVFASTLKSCSQMMMSTVSANSQVSIDSGNEVNPHQMMDHSQHNMMSSADISTSEDQGSELINNCCADNCFCDIASCNYSSVAHHTTSKIISHDSLEAKILFVELSHQNQFLSYLFKPPIFS
ncbi:MAG: hypothetical protein P8I03_01185 [Thalassotalea sp.]|nr:hypothetical protein [Thalassotalea sp.]